MKRVGVFIVLLFIVLSNFTYAGDSQAESTVSPSDVSTSVGGPEANLESVDYFNNDIDLFTGEVAFPLPVASLPGRDGLGYDLNIFYSSRSVDAYSNNGLSPTGVLGLGWNLGLSSITRDSRGTVTSKDDRYYMGGSEIIRNSAGDWILRGDSDFSKIEPDSNTSPSYWIITMIDGTRYHYGHVDPESVTKTFTCGNQMDYIRDCNNGMESYLISSWYLDKIEDHSGKNYITFDYSQIIGEVKTNHMDPGTSYEYTQEIYLDRINDVLGNYIKLNYVLKGSNEYFDPWASSSPSAFQEVTGSKEYLEEVITYVNGNIRRERVLLDYNGPNINSVGNTKRLLNELTHFGRDDTISLPPISFEYNDEGETNPSAFDSESFPGALNKIKLPTGGEVSYTYKKQDIVNTPVKSSLNINKALNEYRSFMGNNYIVKLEYQTQNGRYYMDILEPGINGYTSFLSWDFPSTHPSSSDSPPIVFTGDGHFFVVYPDSANPENYKIAVFSEDRYDSDPRWGTGPRDEWAGIPISTDISLVDQFVSVRDGLVYSYKSGEVDAGCEPTGSNPQCYQYDGSCSTHGCDEPTCSGLALYPICDNIDPPCPAGCEDKFKCGDNVQSPSYDCSSLEGSSTFDCYTSTGGDCTNDIFEPLNTCGDWLDSSLEPYVATCEDVPFYGTCEDRTPCSESACSGGAAYTCQSMTTPATCSTHSGPDGLCIWGEGGTDYEFSRIVAERDDYGQMNWFKDDNAFGSSNLYTETNFGDWYKFNSLKLASTSADQLIVYGDHEYNSHSRKFVNVWTRSGHSNGDFVGTQIGFDLGSFNRDVEDVSVIFQERDHFGVVQRNKESLNPEDYYLKVYSQKGNPSSSSNNWFSDTEDLIDNNGINPDIDFDNFWQNFIVANNVAFTTEVDTFDEPNGPPKQQKTFLHMLDNNGDLEEDSPPVFCDGVEELWNSGLRDGRSIFYGCLTKPSYNYVYVLDPTATLDGGNINGVVNYALKIYRNGQTINEATPLIQIDSVCSAYTTNINNAQGDYEFIPNIVSQGPYFYVSCYEYTKDGTTPKPTIQTYVGFIDKEEEDIILIDDGLEGGLNYQRNDIYEKFRLGSNIIGNKLIVGGGNSQIYNLQKNYVNEPLDVGGSTKSFVVDTKQSYDGLDKTLTTSYDFNEGIFDSKVSQPMFGNVVKSLPENVGTEEYLFYNGVSHGSEDERLNGRLLKKTTKAPSTGIVVAETENDYEIYTGIDVTKDVYDVRLKNTYNRLDGVESRTEYTTYDNSNGLVKGVKSYNSDGTWLSTWTNYCHNSDNCKSNQIGTDVLVNNNILNLPFTVTMVDSSSPTSGQRVRYNLVYYKDWDAGVGAEDILIKESLVQSWKDLDNDGVFDFGGSPDEYPIVRRNVQVDSYGNVLQFKDANGNLNTLTYVPQTSYIQSFTNALSQTKIYSYDSLFNVDIVTDYNNFIVDYNYDKLNRVENVWSGAAGSLEQESIYQYNYGLKGGCTSGGEPVLNDDSTTPQCMNYIHVLSPINPSLTMETRGYTNGLGKNLQTLTKKDASSAIVKNKIFNNEGLIEDVLEPVSESVNLLNKVVYSFFGVDSEDISLLYKSDSGEKAAATGVAGIKYKYSNDPLKRETRTYPLSNYHTADENYICGDCIKDDGSGYCASGQSGSPGSNEHLVDCTQKYYTSDLSCSAGLNCMKVVDANEKYVLYTSDKFGNTLSIENDEQQIAQFEYNNLGQVLNSWGFDTRHSKSNTYNTLGQLETSWTPNSGTKRFTYDLNGNLITTTDESGKVTLKVYDQLNRLLHICIEGRSDNPVNGVCDTGEATIENFYDTNPRGYSCRVDDSGNIINSIGFLCKVKDNIYGSSTEYLYNQDGKLFKVYESLGVNSNYASAHRMITEYDYDNYGNVVKITMPNSKSISFNYGTLNQIETVVIDGETFKFDYFDEGLIENINYRDGDSTQITQSFNYNDENYVENIQLPGLFDESYDYDITGNLAKVTNELGGGSAEFHYTDLYQLRRVLNGGDYYNVPGIFDLNHILYEYDDRGNRESRVVSGSNLNGVVSQEMGYVYGTNTDKLVYTEDTPTFYSYDADGKLRYQDSTAWGGGRIEYEYDDNDKLKRIKKRNEGVILKFTYDALGRRTSKERLVDGVGVSSMTSYVYGNSNNPLIVNEESLTLCGQGIVESEYDKTYNGRCIERDCPQEGYREIPIGAQSCDIDSVCCVPNRDYIYRGGGSKKIAPMMAVEGEN